MNYLRKYYPLLLAIHVPNEGISSRNKNSIAYGAKRKAKGVVPGVPDILIFDGINVQSEKYFDWFNFKGLAIELKVDGGKVSASQEKFMDRLTDCGWACEICWSVDEFIKIIEKYYGEN